MIVEVEIIQLKIIIQQIFIIAHLNAQMIIHIKMKSILKKP